MAKYNTFGPDSAPLLGKAQLRAVGEVCQEWSDQGRPMPPSNEIVRKLIAIHGGTRQDVIDVLRNATTNPDFPELMR